MQRRTANGARVVPLWSIRTVVALAFGSGIVPAFASAQAILPPRTDGATLRAQLAPVMAPPGRAMPADAAALDAMLGKHDWQALTARLRATQAAPEIVLDMNWAQAHLHGGAGFVIAYAYMNDLWRLGSAVPGAPGDGLKQSAAMVMLYGLDLAVVDGVKCADRTAPGRRVDQVFAQNGAILAYLRGLPMAARATIANTSLNIEAATTAVRANDDVLCRGGMDEIRAGLDAQRSKPLTQVPNSPGTVGKTYAVSAPPGYALQFVSAATWVPLQLAARRSLPAMLTRLVQAAPAEPTPIR
ncbi:hypothetical protein [Sphingomonas sp. TREG-RG-20F-R18-01]|uniref:hypothetical protein n=1 Tax=Sphingomonas sp. TREG-RG-20F-R18-01 TaxID=2914982 RepID=UPI001F56A523|nr:hypothetical protein [Sphingomonas sp. TREG-RG-20F-R18-01]